MSGPLFTNEWWTLLNRGSTEAMCRFVVPSMPDTENDIRLMPRDSADFIGAPPKVIKCIGPGGESADVVVRHTLVDGTQSTKVTLASSTTPAEEPKAEVQDGALVCQDGLTHALLLILIIIAMLHVFTTAATSRR